MRSDRAAMALKYFTTVSKGKYGGDGVVAIQEGTRDESYIFKRRRTLDGMCRNRVFVAPGIRNPRLRLNWTARQALV